MTVYVMICFVAQCLIVVGISSGYGVDGPGIGSRWEARFSAPVHTGPGTTQPPVQWVPCLCRG